MGLETPPDFFTQSIWILIILLLGFIIYYLINIGNNYIPEKKKIKISSREIIMILSIVIFLYTVTYVFRKYSIVKDLFTTVIFAVVMAYILNPPVNYIQSRGTKRLYATIIVYGIIFGILFILTFFIVPESIKEIKDLLTVIPVHIDNAQEFLNSLYKQYDSSLGALPPIFRGIENVILENIDKMEIYIVTGISKFINGFIDNLSKIVGLVLMPILSFYFINDKDYFKKKITELIPQRFREDVLELSYEIDTSVSKYVRGRLLMAMSVGLCTFILLMILEVDFAIVIGIITAIADIVPYIGPFLGFIPAVIFAFISSPVKALWVSVFFILIQWAANNILGPKILGNSTGLHPLVVLLAIICGGAIFGVFGMIFSVPVISVIKVVVRFILNKRNNPPKED